MCGIVGIIDHRRELLEQAPVIERMTKALSHRGPDSYGHHVTRHALLGHRRLAVVDPAGGAQPMQRTFHCNTFTIVYNGELYNTEELRAQLKAEGFTFNAYSDTEVLLCAYIAWGPSCVEKLNGIYSFGIWEEKGETLFLCRDPLGVKPLYYMQKDGMLLFASELKALLLHPAVRPVIDADGICEIMGLGPAHAQHSGVFHNINQLPAAHYLLLTPEGISVREYWKLEPGEHKESAKETAEHIRYLLIDAVKRQLVADVPVCTFLSGGLDSSTISAITSEEFKKEGRTLHTFSIDYEDNASYYQANDFQPTSDDAWVDQMSAFIGSEHHRIILNNQKLADALIDAVRANDLPGMADIDSSLLLFCREVRKHATVALSGECADEVFGGYPWYVRKDLAHAGTFPWSGAVKERNELLSPALKKTRLPEYVQAQYEATLSKVPHLPDASEQTREFQRMFYLNIKWFMITLLTRKDRMSMANSLEVRVPFADHRLVEYAYNIPRDMLFYEGREKGLLRKAVTGILPEEIVWRKKSPYPKTFHPQYVNAVSSSLDALVHEKGCRIAEILDMGAVHTLIRTQGRSFGRPWFGQLMTGPQLIAYLLQLELWMREYGVIVDV